MMRTLMIVTPGLATGVIVLLWALWYDRYIARRGRRRT